ncbi:hypothetical protein EHO60_14840 [Leptospira fletcheri]|uniref:Uncharacterized protein n=1 Tax=Leptospira fletcheri TaxID=2484981 RepID=A0A4V3JCJ3_9LEPT|nr:hypothetical protein [Leptospira fletcheri]TGK06319.1 hypothetical protein EHO60_14840 [Leptospira fletcheri]
MRAVALKDLSPKGGYVVVPSAELKEILRQLTDLRQLVEEALIQEALIQKNLIQEQEPTKEEILAGIAEGYKEAQLILAGKLESKSLTQFLNEL